VSVFSAETYRSRNHDRYEGRNEQQVLPRQIAFYFSLVSANTKEFFDEAHKKDQSLFDIIFTKVIISNKDWFVQIF
jgi:hypothetical protein